MMGGQSGSPIDTHHLSSRTPISPQRQETSSHLLLRTALAHSYVSISLTRQQDPERNSQNPGQAGEASPAAQAPRSPWLSMETCREALPHAAAPQVIPTTEPLQPKQSGVCKNQPATDDGLRLPTLPRENGELGSLPREFQFTPFPMTLGIHLLTICVATPQDLWGRGAPDFSMETGELSGQTPGHRAGSLPSLCDPGPGSNLTQQVLPSLKETG